jgi:hypothetical protein
MLRNAQDMPPDVCAKIIRLALQRPDTHSAAAIIVAQQNDLKTADGRLRIGDANDAAALARDPSPERTRLFEKILRDETETPEAKRYAIVGLMMQRTQASRDALRAAQREGTVPEDIRAKLAGWLGE